MFFLKPTNINRNGTNVRVVIFFVFFKFAVWNLTTCVRSFEDAAMNTTFGHLADASQDKVQTSEFI